MTGDTAVESQSAEAQYEKWHRRLDTVVQFGQDPRPGVLIAELLGPDDGPHKTEGLRL